MRYPSAWEYDYLDMLERVIVEGEERRSRAGSTLAIFGTTLVVDCLEQGYFPLLTTRKVYPRGVLGELSAFLKGATTVAEFKAEGCHYWEANARDSSINTGRADDELITGPIYGAQWRDWDAQGLDQIGRLVYGLKHDPHGRRHVVTCWNPSRLHEMCLPPCHIMFQCYVREDGLLDMLVYMRSVDLCIGLPSDIILYAALLAILSQETGLGTGKLKFVFGDTHVYGNHIEQAWEQIDRDPTKPPLFSLARTSIDTFVPRQLDFIGYVHEPAMKYQFNA